MSETVKGIVWVGEIVLELLNQNQHKQVQHDETHQNNEKNEKNDRNGNSVFWAVRQTGLNGIIQIVTGVVSLSQIRHNRLPVLSRGGPKQRYYRPSEVEKVGLLIDLRSKVDILEQSLCQASCDKIEEE